MADEIKYVATPTAPLYAQASGSKRRIELLWGDRLRLLDTGGARWRVRARGIEGFVDPRMAGDTSLLEVYFIDVGQGDGVLIRFPDDRHVMIDGGYNRAKQQTGKNAADFVDWKFVRDYGRDKVVLDAMLSSHCDADHYGGLWDLLEPGQRAELDAQAVEVREFYHAGVSWWDDAGKRGLGPIESDRLVRLLQGRTALRNALRANAAPKLQGEWASFLRQVLACGCGVQRLSNRTAYVPGFEPKPGAASLRVLGPVEPEKGKLYDLGTDSENTNGNSLLLRLDYGRARLLLTGDLNRHAHRRLLEAYTGDRLELACDVAKACHHGSDDVSYEFLAAMKPSATVISSGDSEQHAHPRPAIVSASAVTGNIRIDADTLRTPLVYSTEISRSFRVGKVDSLTLSGNAMSQASLTAAKARVGYRQVNAGDLNAVRGSRRLAGAYVVTGLVYGLVNVRTDGDTLLCATLNEKNSTWDWATFPSRF
jgi:beta-lactamase superfamily II metal-dependent hydrolase